MRGGEDIGRVGVVRAREATRDRDGASCRRGTGGRVAGPHLIDECEAPHREGGEGHKHEDECATHVGGTSSLAVYDDERGLAPTFVLRTRVRSFT